jgi:hypothetical protein
MSSNGLHASGDADGDGIVSGFDFLIWQKTAWNDGGSSQLTDSAQAELPAARRAMVRNSPAGISLSFITIELDSSFGVLLIREDEPYCGAPCAGTTS